MLQKKDKTVINRCDFLKWFNPFFECIYEYLPSSKDSIFLKEVTITDVPDKNYIAVEIIYDFGPFAYVYDSFDGFDVSDVESEANHYTLAYYFNKKDFSFINRNQTVDEVINPITDPDGYTFEVEDLDEVYLSEVLQELCVNLHNEYGDKIHSVLFTCTEPDIVCNATSGCRSNDWYEPDCPADIEVYFEGEDLIELSLKDIESYKYSVELREYRNSGEYDLLFNCCKGS